MTKTIPAGMRWLTLLAALAIYPACDDAGGAPGDQDTGTDTGPGMGGMGGEGGGAGGMGGGGGGEDCLEDVECPDEQYCEIGEDDFIGSCEDGCRQGGCDAGQECNLTSRECRCTGDEGCSEEEFCDTDTGACMPRGEGCVEDADCDELSPEGRTQKCVIPEGDPVGDCVDAFVCCSGDDGQACDLQVQDACDGEVVNGALSCQESPCQGAPCASDDECPEDRYCNTDDGRCLVGCRTEPDNCPGDILICDPEKHTCEEIPCDTDEECPDGEFFCNDDGICEGGCDEDSCPEGEVCDEATNTCQDFGDMCNEDADCQPNEWCDEQRMVCRDDCEDNEVCLPDEFCDVQSNECVVGCRDDQPAFDSRDNALEIELPGMFNPQGFKIAVVDMRRFCDDQSDFFSVSLGQGERMQLQLIYPEDVLENINLRLFDSADGGPVDEVEGIESTKTIEYPGVGEVEPATEYFAEVFGDIAEELGVDYRVRVVVADASNPCFPDEREGDGAMGADNNRAGATRQQAELAAYAGTLCNDDEDWFVLNMGATDGMNVDLTVVDGDDVEFLIYSAANLDQGGIGNPDHRSPAMGVAGANGATTWSLRLPQAEGHFGPGDWYVRVKTRDAGDAARYTLRIERLRGPECGDDGGTEPNDGVDTAVDLRVDQYGVAMDGEVPLGEDLRVDLNLEICARDEDVFCFDVEAGDTVEAWTVGGGVAGDFVIQLLNAEGGNVGERGNNNRMGSDSRARWRGANEGRVCVRVDGIQAGQGPYELFIRRSEGGDMCMNDEDEFGQARNDVASAATPMAEVEVEIGQRFEYSGYICDVQGQDEDWYSFNIPEPNSAVCVMTSGFQNAVANLDMSIFPDAPQGDMCNNDEDCNLGAGGARARCIRNFCGVPCNSAAQCADEEACLDGRCTASPNGYFSRTGFNFEAKSIARSVLGERNGEHYFRVDRGAAGAESGYNISVTVSPFHEPEDCPLDFQEINGPNDRREDATPLGAGQVGFCDAWICGETEGNLSEGDWYEITVPANQDRTVIVEFAPLPIDGRLQLDSFDPEWMDMDDPFGGLRSVKNPIAGFQCINIEGGNAEQNILLNVTVDNIAVGDPDGRVDYTFRVVPTDLDADPQGECLTYGAPDLGACDRDFSNIAEDCWPYYPIAN